MHMPSENIAVIGAISPASGAGGNTGWISVADFSQLLAIGMIGATDHDIDAKLEGATDSSGTGAADITDHAITQLGNASADDKQVMINLRTRALAKNNFTHVRFSVTGTGGAAALISGLLLGYEPHSNVPGVSRNAASVAEVVAVKPGS